MDDWEIGWTRTNGFSPISKYPLANASEEQLLQYEFPFKRIDRLVLSSPASMQGPHQMVKQSASLMAIILRSHISRSRVRDIWGCLADWNLELYYPRPPVVHYALAATEISTCESRSTVAYAVALS